MPDVAASPLSLCLLVIVVGAVSSLLPVSPVEPWLIGIGVLAPATLVPVLVVLVTLSTMSAKVVVFLGGRRVQALFKGRTRARFETLRERVANKPRLQNGTLFLSSVFGLPPFYLMTAVCGTLRMPLGRFIMLASAGRAIRFGILMVAPQLIVTPTASAQTNPPAVRVAGAGGQTYVLLSGLVGGTAGFRRLEARLVAAGKRVVSVDPYQLAIDSQTVSFDAMSRIVDAELAKQGITTAVVVGHSHGGGVALRLAAHAPGRVSALYLLDVGALETNRGAVFSSAIRLVPIIARIPTGKAFIRHRLMSGMRENSANQEWLDDATRHAYCEPLIRNVDRVVAMALRLADADEPESVQAVADRVVAPVTVLVGSFRTKAGPTDAEFRVLQLKRQHFAMDTITGAGHFPHEEQPDRVAARLLRPPRVVAVLR